VDEDAAAGALVDAPVVLGCDALEPPWVGALVEAGGRKLSGSR
jgi:hypothetical protein